MPQPTNLFVAAFIGSPGDEPRRGLDRAATSSSSAASVCPSRTVAAPSTRSTASSSGSGPRPSRTPRSHRQTFRVSRSHVDVVEELGADTHAFFRVDAPRDLEPTFELPTTTRPSSQASERCSRRVSIRARGSGRPGTSTLAVDPGALPFLRSRRRRLAPLAGRRGGRRGHRHEQTGLDQNREAGRMRDHNAMTSTPRTVTKQTETRNTGARPDRAARRRRRDPVRAAALRRPRRLAADRQSRARRSRPRRDARAAARERDIRQRAEDRPGADDDLLHRGHAAPRHGAREPHPRLACRRLPARTSGACCTSLPPSPS